VACKFGVTRFVRLAVICSIDLHSADTLSIIQFSVLLDVEEFFFSSVYSLENIERKKRKIYFNIHYLKFIKSKLISPMTSILIFIQKPDKDYNMCREIKLFSVSRFSVFLICHFLSSPVKSFTILLLSHSSLPFLSLPFPPLISFPPLPFLSSPPLPFPHLHPQI
jgi:hypothetical protein